MIDMNKDAVGTVDDLIKSMKIAVGLEKAPEAPIDPFASPVRQVQPKVEAEWQPIQRSGMDTAKQAKEDDEALELIASSPVFKNILKQLDPLIDALGEEVLNPETPYSQVDAEEELNSFILEALDKEKF